MNKKINVAVVDVYPLYRTGIVHSLRARKRFSVIGQGECANDAIDLCAKQRPRILLLGFNMPGGESLNAIKRIKRDDDYVRIIVLADIEEDAYIVSTFDAGADGYLTKNVPVAELVSAMDAVNSEQNYVDPKLAARQLLQAKSERVNGAHFIHADLSPRENQVLEKVARGLTNKEIARQLVLSEKTIKHYLSNIMQKLNVRNRVEASNEARVRLKALK